MNSDKCNCFLCALKSLVESNGAGEAIIIEISSSPTPEPTPDEQREALIQNTLNKWELSEADYMARVETSPLN